jgi:hypothetical protein
MARFGVKSLDEAAWPDFAQLVERHRGVWGGWWCMAFHPEGVGRAKTAAQNRDEKECRVAARRRQGGKLSEDVAGRRRQNSRPR